MDEKELKELMLRESPEFKKVFEAHQHCEKALKKMGGKSFLTDEEKLQEIALKKQKLVLKDKMYRMMTEHGKTV